ncbi:hypothetical protein U1Q18_049728, partial [Sarracenia purpurea var. burkii]
MMKKEILRMNTTQRRRTILKLLKEVMCRLRPRPVTRDIIILPDSSFFTCLMMIRAKANIL